MIYRLREGRSLLTVFGVSKLRERAGCCDWFWFEGKKWLTRLPWQKWLTRPPWPRLTSAHSIRRPSLPYDRVQDMEPEYIAVTENGNTAYVSLQVGGGGTFRRTQSQVGPAKNAEYMQWPCCRAALRASSVCRGLRWPGDMAVFHGRSPDPRYSRPSHMAFTRLRLSSTSGKQRRGEDRHQGLPDQAHVPARIQGVGSTV